MDNQLTEQFDDSQGMSPQRETIARISLFFAGENRRYTASCSPALRSRSEGRRGDSSEAMAVADTLTPTHLYDKNLLKKRVSKKGNFDCMEINN